MKSHPPAIIALITDFGTKDWFAGSVQGRILRECPDARLVNVTHSIPPGDVYAASYVLAACMGDFPAGTLFVTVVDPGVGTDRKAIMGRMGPYTVLAPDNGLLTHAMRRYARNCGPLYEVSPRHLSGEAVSSTFHGRDVFAPIAGRVAAGTLLLEELGDIVQRPVVFEVMKSEVRRGEIIGHVRYIDHFGNAITNISGKEMALFSVRSSAYVEVGAVKVPLRSTFAEVAPGRALTYVGSNGYLEVAVNGGSAAEQMEIWIGQEVRFHAEQL
jgi:S-adenosylmethionine hydrolase